MTNDEVKKMCLALLHADSEKEVIEILTQKGFWEKEEYWRYYGDKEDNFSTTGNQQSRPEAALVEKVVNSVDAVLMNACWLTGISPENSAAPKSIYEAVALYFGGDAKKYDTLGHIGYWPTQKRTEVSRLITVVATGDRSNPSFTISDAGEGQTPNKMPDTLLDLSHKNKLGVHFVQGKFNMGSTGVFQFCGRHNLQLIITRRNPNIVKNTPSDNSDNQWSFTVIRRENPTPGRKSSVYTYLAPLGAMQKPRDGDVLRFSSNTFPVFPEGRNPYGRDSEWGTAIKLYEYAASGFRTNMMLRDGLLSRLDILLPEIALPIRLHECRDYKGHTGSFETTVSGLSVRLEDNKGENLEDDFPSTSSLAALGEKMTVKIYAFKKDRAETYRKNEGIIFTVNGQTHANLPLSFFSRKNVGMGRLDDSILVVVDCTDLSGRAREDLFMNSRDRLRNHELRDEIERELEILIRDHPGLRALREKRRNEEIQAQVGNSKPLEEAIKSILKSSPSLSSLFLTGTRFSSPFKTKQVSSEDRPYKGNLHPSYFKFQKLNYGKVLERTTAINMRCRVTFETDVDNDYFYRLQNRGKFNLLIVDNGETKEVNTYSLNLQNGKATLNVRLPANCSVGDKFRYEARVTDEVILKPFVNSFVVTIGQPQTLQPKLPIKDGKSPSDKDGIQRETPTGMQIPEVNEVYEQDWDKRKHKFDQYSALEILQEEAANIEETGHGSNAIYSFWVNMDNIYLKVEEKYSKTSPDIIKARYKYGLVLIGMALIQADAASDKSKVTNESNGETINGEELPLAERVYKASSAIAPVLLPLIDSLGNLTEDQVKVGSQIGDDE
ncbi:MAG: hypothetical protein D4R82_06265 [Dehalococcoidia bacterium]|nr:MAG: hypothetical protein D4R82_06265 [Dehalococcoidia bacterium]